MNASAPADAATASPPKPALRDMAAFLGRVWRLSLPYFGQSDERWRARLLLAAIVALNLLTVYVLVLINDWNRLFYDALQEKNAEVFWQQLTRFCYLAAGFIVVAVYKFWLTQLLELRWRAWLTQRFVSRWLDGPTAYRLEIERFQAPPRSDAARHAPNPDNPDQRIQEDLGLFTSYTVGLSMGLLNAVVTLVSFIGILWALSGGFVLPLGSGRSVEIAGFMVWAAVIYCVVGSLLSHFIGRPLARLNFDKQRREADFRHHLVRLREHAEAIALERGQAVEQAESMNRFGRVFSATFALLAAQKRLTWFTVGFGQAAVIFPFVVAAPRFFSGAIQLGELMQIASAFGRVQDALSWFVDNYPTLAAWRATTDRLTGFEAALEANPAAAPISTAEVATNSIANVPGTASDTLVPSRTQVALPNGRALLDASGLDLQAGDTVALVGPSGSGKSSLLRAWGGIWPWAQGAQPGQSAALAPEVRDQAMFLPQRPYLPQGPLRTALAYPLPAERFSDAELAHALTQAELPQLVARLDEHAAWDQTLSGGEQQRLALARVWLKQPRWVFADEITSALDEATEARLYQRLLAQVQARSGALVSIAHKPAVAALHAGRWTVVPAPDGAPAAPAQVVVHKPGPRPAGAGA